MHARRGRPVYLIAVTLVGVTLVAIAFVLQQSDSRHRSAPAPEPAWRTADRNVAILQHQLRPLAAGDSIVPPRALDNLRAFGLPESTSDPIHVRMTRSMNSGHVFDAAITLTCRAVQAGQDVELNVARGNGQPVRVLVEVRAGATPAIHLGSGTSAPQASSRAEDLPLALGDLPVGEVFELCRAFASGRLEPLGYLDGLGSRPQLVLETRLVPMGSRSPRSDHETPAAGVRALAYVDSATCDLRSVRVLDAKDYVVRVYDDLVWETEGSRPRLSELQVTSMPSSSHTVFHRALGERRGN